MRTIKTLSFHNSNSVLWLDDSGQDLIEYALLSGFIGVISVVAWSVMEGSLGAKYSALDSDTQGLWESPNPVGS